MDEENKISSDELKQQLPDNINIGGEFINQGNVEVDGEQLPQTHTPEQFNQEYQSLCQKMGYIHQISPAFAPTNHGTFEIRLDIGIAPLKQG